MRVSGRVQCTGFLWPLHSVGRQPHCGDHRVHCGDHAPTRSVLGSPSAPWPFTAVRSSSHLGFSISAIRISTECNTCGKFFDSNAWFLGQQGPHQGGHPGPSLLAEPWPLSHLTAGTTLTCEQPPRPVSSLSPWTIAPFARGRLPPTAQPNQRSPRASFFSQTHSPRLQAPQRKATLDSFLPQATSLCSRSLMTPSAHGPQHLTGECPGALSFKTKPGAWCHLRPPDTELLGVALRHSQELCQWP